jgi:uncharacterized protein YecT (DUF1311 family)
MNRQRPKVGCVAVLTVLVGLATTGDGRKIPAREMQSGMNEAAGVRLRAAEGELKRVLDELVAKGGGRAEAIAKLRAAQSAWEAYRDAQLAALWPLPAAGRYGSVNPMCVDMVKDQLTRARTRELRTMLKPVEGDACSSQWPG